MADVVADVAAISEALGVDRFVVSGGSGGGPPAKAIVTVLNWLPYRLTRDRAEAFFAT